LVAILRGKCLLKKKAVCDKIVAKNVAKNGVKEIKIIL